MIARPQAQAKTRPDASLRRALLVAAFIVLWMVAIGLRLVHLQVSMHDELSDRAHSQQQGAIETGFERGQLADREGRQLARSIETESVFVAPDEIIDVALVSELLAKSLGADHTVIATEIAEAGNNSRRFLWNACGLPSEQAHRLGGCEARGR